MTVAVTLAGGNKFVTLMCCSDDVILGIGIGYWYRWRPIVLGTIGYASWYRSNRNIWVNGKMQICGYDAEVGLGLVLGNLHMVITSTYPHLCILPPAINMAVLKSSLIFCTQS